MWTQLRFIVLLPLLILLSCGSPQTDANAVPGFLTAVIDGKKVKATCEVIGVQSSDAPGKLQLHFIFKDSGTGTDLFSVIVFRYAKKPARISNRDLMPLAPDSVLPTANTITKNDSLSWYESKMDFEINSYEDIDAGNAKVSGRLSGRLYYDVEKPAGKQPYLEIRNGVFTAIDVTIM